MLTLSVVVAPPADRAVELSGYLPLLLMLGAAAAFAAVNLVATRLIGPSRTGDIKGMAYESGMNPVTSARKRFNVRFYLIAMVFLVFDVEVVFLYPWAVVFGNLDPMSPQGAEYLARVLFFLLTTVLAYAYGFRKGVFRFD